MQLITPPVFVITSILLITSCTSVSTTHPNQIEEIQDQIQEINNHIPPEFLVKCEWLSPLKEGTQSALLEVNKQIIKDYTDCYLRHNTFVNWYTSTQKDNQ